MGTHSSAFVFAAPVLSMFDALNQNICVTHKRASHGILKAMVTLG